MSMRTTVGPLPTSVYWRRRALVFGVLLLAVLTLKACLSGGGSGPKKSADQKQHVRTPFIGPSVTATATGTPATTGGSGSTGSGGSGSGTTTATPTATGSGPAQCVAADLEVSTSTDLKSYKVGTMPKFTITVKNVSSRPCTRDLSAKAVEFRVLSGQDRIWSSVDCAPPVQPQQVLLQPGQAQSSTQVWGGHRSDPNGCSSQQAEAKAGYYRLVGVVGTITGKATIFQLT